MTRPHASWLGPDSTHEQWAAAVVYAHEHGCSDWYCGANGRCAKGGTCFRADAPDRHGRTDADRLADLERRVAALEARS